MAATEADAAPAVREDGKIPEDRGAEKDGAEAAAPPPPEGEALPAKEPANDDAVVGEDGEAGAGGGGGDDPAPSQGADNHEHKTSFLDSFLNKSGLGKVMAGRKKKETAAEDSTAAADVGDKEAEKSGEQPEPEAEAAALENGDKDEEKKSKESKSSSSVRDLIRKPVAKIFSHKSAEKKEADSPGRVKVRSKSLDRLEDARAAGEGEADGEHEADGAEGEAEAEHQAASSSAVKHVKRWHSFKKLMAPKTHKRSGAGGEDAAAATDGEGGGDSSTLDSKESGQKRWKLKRSWTFQGLKRDHSMVGISGKSKGGDKEAPDGEDDGEKAEDGEEEDKAGTAAAAAPAGGTVTQHANEIWTSFKKRVIPKSKRANTECQPGAEDDVSAAATAATASGEDGAAEDGKDGKSAKAKRSHFGRAVSLKNFILRKGKSASLDTGDGAKEEEATGAEQVEDGERAGAEEDGDADRAVVPEKAGGDGEASKASEVVETADEASKASEGGAETPGDGEARRETPVANGENGCENGTGEEDERPDRDGDKSPLKMSKEVGGAKEETNAKVINAAPTPVNSEKKAGSA
ncbi:uncharacterized protein LOC144083256 isoform X2 [Stigmatopora argus]